MDATSTINQGMSNFANGIVPPAGVTPNNVPDSQVNSGPGTVSAYNISAIKPAPNPVSDTSGIRSNVNNLNAGINGVNTGVPSLSAPIAPAFGQYTPQQKAAIDAAGSNAGSSYDSLIRQAQYEKEQGMAKSIVNAGERGGFMNSQFSGIAANTPINGNNFVGAGGQLENIKSQYDLNIQDLQAKKISAINAAKDAMTKYTDSGKQQDYENARTSYQDAVKAQQDQAKAVADAQAATVAAQKASFDLSVPLSQAGEKVQQYALDQLTKYPGVVSDYLAAGGNASDFNHMSANQLAGLISKNPQFQQDQLKASLGPGSIGEYQYAKSQGYKGTFEQYQNEDANRKRPVTYVNSSGGTDVAHYAPIDIARYSLASNRIVGNYIDLPQYKLTAQGLPYIQKIAVASEDPGSVSDQELLDSYTKLSNAGNAISDAQIKLITGGQSYSDAINVFQNKLKNGGVLSDKQRADLQKLANATFDKYKQGYQPVYDKVTSQLKAAGIPSAFWTIPDLNTLSAQADPKKSGTDGGSNAGGAGGQTYSLKGVTYVLGSDGTYYPQ